MISLRAAILLALGLTLAVEGGRRPNCGSCKYTSGIGYLSLKRRCDAYIMCFKSPYQPNYYRHKFMCCPIGTRWDPEHLTCKRDRKCTSDRIRCPNETTTSDLPCPFKALGKDGSQYSYKATHEVMSCPYRSFFDPRLCTCRFGGPYKKPCCKLLHFNFAKNYDSRSCYNFAAGEPYGNPPLVQGVLCLNGIDQSFAIPYLRNYFAWNPIAKGFTLCVWLKVGKAGQDAGVISTNCKNPEGRSLLELYLKNGVLYGNFGGKMESSEETPVVGEWTQICVTFNRGIYILYYNADHTLYGTLKGSFPINSQEDLTLGFVRGKGYLNGYFDDFCYWTKVFPKKKVKVLMGKGPSTKMDNPPSP